MTKDKLEYVVPVVIEVPGRIMGSGIGGEFIENIDYDIQTTDPKTVEEFGLKKLRLGDLVAIIDPHANTACYLGIREKPFH